MGMMDRFIGVGSRITAVTNVASGVVEALGVNPTRKLELEEEAYSNAVAQHQAEFQTTSGHWFDAAMNGLNRMPRPFLTLGTMGLFVYAMVEPVGFSHRMEGLALVPEPLWWLMGAIVSFYFGAREAHYLRQRTWTNTARPAASDVPEDDGWRAPIIPTGPFETLTEIAASVEVPATVPSAATFADNAALRDWAEAAAR